MADFVDECAEALFRVFEEAVPELSNIVAADFRHGMIEDGLYYMLRHLVRVGAPVPADIHAMLTRCLDEWDFRFVDECSEYLAQISRL
ncbi:hypothetical protein [Rhodococcus sp. Q]|uniref:hypothetical protein n=1 Tax=Rhodococcus sp. Q TaxID=2502252 RepID=UPI0010F7AF8E|nr:hypothetical protein [Rhodococcus sp. Q]